MAIRHAKSTKLILYILMFNLFITMSGIGIIIPVMPEYLKQYDLAGRALGGLIACFAFAQFLLSPTAGNLSDKYGRKKLILFGLTLYGVAQICFGLANQVWLIFVFRFLAGVGAAFIIPPIMAFAADITTIKARGKAMGLMGAGLSLGIMIGPGIGGFLSKISLHFPFIFGGIFALFAAVISFFILPNIELPQQVAKNDNIFKQMAQSIKQPYFVILIIIFVFSTGIANFQSTMSLFVTERFQYTPVDIAIIMTFAGGIGVVIQMFVIDPLFKWIGEMRVILINLLIAGAMMIAILFAPNFASILLVATIFSTATTLIRPATNTLVSKLAGNQQGMAAGLNNAYMSLGNMIGPLFAGILFDWQTIAPYIFGLIILVGCYITTRLWAQSKAPELLQKPQQ